MSLLDVSHLYSDVLCILGCNTGCIIALLDCYIVIKVDAVYHITFVCVIVVVFVVFVVSWSISALFYHLVSFFCCNVFLIA